MDAALRVTDCKVGGPRVGVSMDCECFARRVFRRACVKVNHSNVSVFHLVCLLSVCDVPQLHHVPQRLKLLAVSPPSEEDGERPEHAGLQLLLVFLRHVGVPVGEDGGFVVVVGEDVLGDAVEVGAVGGFDMPGEEGLEGDLDDFVGEQEDGLQFCSQASQEADDFGQVVVDAAGDVEVDGEAAFFGGHALRVVVEVQWRHAGCEQNEIALGWLEGDGRDADARLREYSAETVDLLARGEPFVTVR